jgi:UDP-4-amino-4,6-dideoxy-N-acetyl-beta-L-altrosamine transaminase
MKIPYGIHSIDNDDIKEVIKALKSNHITQGKTVKKFENNFKNIVGAKYAVAVSSCSAGLHLCMKALNIQKKDTVATSPISFVSTATSVIHESGKLEFVDIDEETGQICPNKLKKTLLKKKIKTIIPVHISGAACKIKELSKICSKKKINIIEDAAHSFGAKYPNNKMVGSCQYSLCTVFSFHPVKTITTGEGGMITTNSKKMYEKLMILRSHGINKNHKSFKNKILSTTRNVNNPWYYEMIELGMHYRITDIQCALGLSQLRKYKLFIEKRKKIAKYYDKYFEKKINFEPLLNKYRSISSNHLYIIKIKKSFFKKISKAEIMYKLKKRGITTQVHYIPIPYHPYFVKKGYGMKNLICSKNFYEEVLSIPIFYNLNMKKQKYIIQEILKIFNNE